MSGFTQIDSGRDLMKYLEDRGLYIEHAYAVGSWQNCIFLTDRTSFNWKAKNRQVRINCKGDVKDVIEAKSGLSAIDNHSNDKTREWSFLLDGEQDLDKIIELIKPMLDENNRPG